MTNVLTLGYFLCYKGVWSRPQRLAPAPLPGHAARSLSAEATGSAAAAARGRKGRLECLYIWHHHMALSLLAVWFLIGEIHRGQQLTPALTLPQVRYGLSRLLMEVFCPPGVDDICRQVQRQLVRNESARFHHHSTRKCMPPRKLRQ